MRSTLPLFLALLAAPAVLRAAPAENAVGEILFKAREADGMKRLSRGVFFDGGKGSTLVMFFELSVRKDHVRTEMVEYKRSGSWKGERCKLNFGGSLRSLELARGKGMNEPKPADVLAGTVKEGTIEFKTGDGQAKPELTLKLEGAVVPLGVAMLVLPAYQEFLPAEPLALSVLLDAQTIPMRIMKGKAGEGTQEVKLQGPSGIAFVVQVSTAAETKGKVLSLVVNGETKKQLTRAQADELMKSIKQAGATKDEGASKGAKGYDTPQAAVEALIAACKAKDLAAAGACFSPLASKEFQSLRDGSCPPKMFAQLCDMFSGASIESTKVKGESAAVAVNLSKGRETLNMIKGPGGWLILDF